MNSPHHVTPALNFQLASYSLDHGMMVLKLVVLGNLSSLLFKYRTVLYCTLTVIIICNDCTTLFMTGRLCLSKCFQRFAKNVHMFYFGSDRSTVDTCERSNALLPLL